MNVPIRLKSERGFSLLELLVSTAIMVTVTGAIFALMNPGQGSGQVQPEVADQQQRLRIAHEALFKELVMAGAGPYQGATTGSLINFFAPILPRRVGRTNPDPTQGAGSFKTDKITLTYVPNSYSQTTISSAMPPNSAELKVNDQPNCPKGRELCGFEIGQDVVIFDTTGNFDTFTITNVQDSAGHLQHRGQDLNHKYESGASVTMVNQLTYYLDRTTNQLMRYDGVSDVAIADNIVDLRFDYYGDPNPPEFPKPPAGVANCLYDAAGNYAGPGVLPATHGSLAALTSAILTNGPYCGTGGNQFDADLLRVRKVRVTLRVQTALEGLRSTDTALFMKPGKARGSDRVLPDYRVTFEVTPRNLNLSR
jgi:prepilin-type N-terminal cleavage/methylation domain-containing protein